MLGLLANEWIALSMTAHPEQDQGIAAFFSSLSSELNFHYAWPESAYLQEIE